MHGQDRVDEADAHERDHAREGDGPDGLGLHASYAWAGRPPGAAAAAGELHAARGPAR